MQTNKKLPHSSTNFCICTLRNTQPSKVLNFFNVIYFSGLFSIPLSRYALNVIRIRSRFVWEVQPTFLLFLFSSVFAGNNWAFREQEKVEYTTHVSRVYLFYQACSGNLLPHYFDNNAEQPREPDTTI